MAWNLSLVVVFLGTALADFVLGTFVWDLSLGMFRLETFAWNLSLGICRLGSFASGLPLEASPLGSEQDMGSSGWGSR